MEAMAAGSIDVGLAVAGALLLDGLDVGHRNAGVLLAEVQLRRALRLLVGEGHDAGAVIAACGAAAPKPRRGEKRDGAAHAEADDAERACALEVFERSVG